MTTQELPRVCGNCKHWLSAVRYYHGKCTYNLPVWAIRLIDNPDPLISRDDKQAEDCDYYTPKEDQ
jgi:hypothetical protein